MRVVMFGFLLMVGLWGATPSQAAMEARCTELGANCVCSAPLQGALSSRFYSGTAYLYYFAGETDPDATTKPCHGHDNDFAATYFGITANSSFERIYGGDDITSTSDSTILNLLPAGHTISHVIRASEGYVASIFLGYEDLRAVPISVGPARLAYRWYQYYSPNWAFTYDNGGACTNGKIGQIGNVMTATYQFAGTPAFYSMNNLFTEGQNWNCCSSGPSNDLGPTGAEYRGKWWRYEMVVSGLGTTGQARAQVFVKNITDNLAERTILDTNSLTSSGPQPWAGHPTPFTWPQDQTPSRRPLNEFTHEPYRAGTCPGFGAWTHYMLAAWTTDSGQRILGATEVEGSGDVTPPAAPTGVQITKVTAGSAKP